MEDQPQAENPPLSGRNQYPQVTLDLDRVDVGGQSESKCQSAHVGINREAWQIKCHAAYNIRRLPTDPGQGDEILPALGNLTTEPGDQALSHAHQVAGLGPEEPGRVDDLLHLAQVGRGQ